MIRFYKIETTHSDQVLEKPRFVGDIPTVKVNYYIQPARVFRDIVPAQKDILVRVGPIGLCVHQIEG